MRNPRRTTRLLALSLCVTFLCSACGYRGSLYYIDEVPPPKKPSVIAPTQ